MSEVRHRLAMANDLPRLLEIYNRVIEEGGFTADLEPYTLAQRQVWFDEHRHAPFQIYVVEVDTEVLGYFYLSPWRGGRKALRSVAEVSYYLAAEARGKGLGRYMLQQAEVIALASGIRSLLAILLECNLASRTLLEKGDFTLAGILPDVADLGERNCGQLIMFKQLGKGIT
ncbi:MAG: N-acetyltransferase [Desulfuromonas sp.]|nr:MAG: N-acetyltransferase [Desulfuromonas sp.]